MKRLFQEENKSHTMRWVGAVAILGLLLAACAPATPVATNTPVPTTPVSTDTVVPTVAATATVAPTTAATGAATTAATTAATAMATTAATAMATPAAVVVNVATNTTLGKILVDGAGMTLYKYANDTSGTSTCSASCLANWPPLLAGGAVTPDPSLAATDFSTAMTTDGRTMVTYKGAPLYHYKGDAAAGDTNGNGVGGVWSVVAP